MIGQLEQLRDLAHRYLNTDLDRITARQISQDIAIIQGITNEIEDIDGLQVICQLLTSLTSHLSLSVAHGYALDEVPRSLAFYENMIDSERIMKQIVKAME